MGNDPSPPFRSLNNNFHQVGSISTRSINLRVAWPHFWVLSPVKQLYWVVNNSMLGAWNSKRKFLLPGGEIGFMQGVAWLSRLPLCLPCMGS